MNQHRLDAESALRSITPFLEGPANPTLAEVLAAAQAHATLALVHEIATLRESLLPTPVAPEEPITAASLVDAAPPLSTLASDAIVDPDDYPAAGFGEPAGRVCSECRANPGEPCFQPSGLTLSHRYHRARFDGVPF